MYDLPYHKEKDPQAIDEFISRYPFAFLCGSDGENKPVGTQIPLILEERDDKKILIGHIMRNTDHHKAFLDNKNVLVVFTGPHVYVSGTWYSNPHTPSTWNYMSVHVKGVIRFLEDGDALDEVIRKTTLHFENNNERSTTAFDNIPVEIRQRVMKAIVAFEIEINETDNVFKLSQDRDHTSYQQIIEKLRDKGEDGKMIAAEMEKRTAEVFPGHEKCRH